MLRLRRLASAAALVAASSLVTVPSAAAEETEPPNKPKAPEPWSVVLDAGVACPDFPLAIDAVDGRRGVKQFVDDEGEVIRVIETGIGQQVTLTNAATGDTLPLRSNGAVMNTTVNPDGTTTVVSTGHIVLILFPSDVPAGPSTTLMVGRVEYTVDAADVFTVQRLSGRTVDLCAELAS